jgi:phosphoglycerol transferase MdoB-like AlkP superfamily enzyme
MNKLSRAYRLAGKKWNAFLDRFKTAGPLSPLLFFLFIALFLFFLSRLALNLIYWQRIVQEPKFLKLYVVGVRMDLIVICYFLFLPAIFFLLLPKSIMRYIKYFWIFYFTFFIGFAFFMEMSTFAFVREYDLRPDTIFVKYLNHFKEVSATVWKADMLDVILTFSLLIAVVWFAWRSFKYVISNYQPMKWYYRILLLPVIGGLLFLGARSSFAPRPANISTAYWSEKNKLVNELTLNSTYSVIMAITRLKDEKDPSAVYGSMDEKEIFSRVKKNLLIPDSSFERSDIPFYHKQFSRVKQKRPLNVVIILEESLGAEYVGALGGLPLTPNLDKLSKEGLFFTDLYSTGTRTVRGIEAVVTGFLPTPGNSIVNLGLSRTGFFTAGQLFKKAGYSTSFIYGGQSNFDEMRSFFLGNGIEHVYDEPTFHNYAFKGTWGVSDEDLVTKADEVFRAQGDKPFFSLILSTSNHSPFEFPDGRIQLYEQPKNSVHNAMKYADFAIGKFFELAKKSDYYKNTIFLVVADHNTRVFGDEFVPVNKFHIPGLIIGPGVPAMAYSKVASQVDLLPTMLDFAGINTENPMIGRDVMMVPENDPGRCFMQYGMNYGYMRGDSVVILKPYLKPQEFIYDKHTLKLTALDSANKEMSRDALAFSLLPWKLYESRRYRLAP